MMQWPELQPPSQEAVAASAMSSGSRVRAPHGHASGRGREGIPGVADRARCHPLGIDASFGANRLAETDSWRVRAHHRSREILSDQPPTQLRRTRPSMRWGGTRGAPAGDEHLTVLVRRTDWLVHRPRRVVPAGTPDSELLDVIAARTVLRRQLVAFVRVSGAIYLQPPGLSFRTRYWNNGRGLGATREQDDEGPKGNAHRPFL